MGLFPRWAAGAAGEKGRLWAAFDDSGAQARGRKWPRQVGAGGKQIAVMALTRRDPTVCLHGVRQLLATRSPLLPDGGRGLRAVALSRAVSELFAAVYSNADLSGLQADAFVREHDVVNLMAVAIERNLAWPHRFGVLDHAAGLLDNFFTRRANYVAAQHSHLRAAIARAFAELARAEVSRGFQLQLESALESVLLLLGRLMARESPEQGDSSIAASALSAELAAVLVDREYRGYVRCATLHPLQQLLCCPRGGLAARATVAAFPGATDALRGLALEKQKLSYVVVSMAMTCLAALGHGGGGETLALLRASEEWLDRLLLGSPAVDADLDGGIKGDRATKGSDGDGDGAETDGCGGSGHCQGGHGSALAPAAVPLGRNTQEDKEEEGENGDSGDSEDSDDFELTASFFPVDAASKTTENDGGGAAMSDNPAVAPREARGGLLGWILR